MAALHTFLVLTNAVPGREQEFNAWYDHQHLPDLLKIPGVKSARRLTLSDVQRDEPPYSYRYCALYEIEADATRAVLERIRAEAGTPAMPVSDAMEKERLALVFRPLNTVEAVEDADARSRPPIDAKRFRQCLSSYPTGVTIITADDGATRAGVTANSFASLSLDPPLVLWSIQRRSRSFDVFARTRAFAVNILGEGQIDLAQRFSSSLADKFDGIAWETGRNGCPLIPGAIAHLECGVEWTADAGDHLLIVGRVNSFFHSPEARPLLFSAGGFGSLAPSAPGETNGADAERTAAGKPFFRLVFEAFSALSDAFEKHRREEGATAAQIRMLIACCEAPGEDVEELARKMRLSAADGADAVEDLCERGEARLDGFGVWPTEAGLKRRADIARREKEFDDHQMKGLSPAEIQAARSILKKMIERSRLHQ